MPTTPSKKPPAKRVNKRDKALALMRRPSGATLAELTRSTGWLRGWLLALRYPTPSFLISGPCRKTKLAGHGER
jgi:hypothetical protein